MAFIKYAGLIVLLVIIGLAVLTMTASWFRQQFILPFFLKKLKSKLPPISNTEREAIQAGNTWWEKELFSGSPNWQNLYAIPRPQLSAEEQTFLDNQVEQLCSMLDDWQIVFENRDLSPDVWAFLKKEKFFGLVIPKEYGGLGFSALAHSTIITKIATRSISAAVNTMVPNSLGPAELLNHYGTPEQKSYYLPRLARGDEIPCFALTAPEAGSDAGSIPDTGIVCRGWHDGKEIIGVRLTWDKRYITLAPIATVLGLAFKMYDPDHLLGDKEDIGITLCLLPTSHPGVEIGNRHYPLQLAFLNGPTRGNDVFIPLDWIIGGPRMAGQGWRMLMECLSIGRAISLPALSTATAKLCYRNTGAYARLRRQFNVPLSSFEGIEEALGNIAGYTYMLEATRIMTAGAVDQKIRPSTASAIAKYHMTELSRLTIAHAMDVHAGHAIQSGPRNFLANVHVSIPISIAVEGANILTRNLIIFGQGAIRCHPYLLKEIEEISADNPSLPALDNVLMQHIWYVTKLIFCNIFYGFTGGYFIQVDEKNKKIAKYQRQLTRMSTAFALISDVCLMQLGGNLKRRERLSARLGDILSQLYMASSVMKYFHDNNEPVTDEVYVSWALSTNLFSIQTALNELMDNFPNRFLGKLLSWMIFPFGNAYKKPNDEQHKSLVNAMLLPSALRDRITQNCYRSKDHDDIGRRLDLSLELIADVDPILKKIHQAVKEGRIPQAMMMDEKIRAAKSAGILTFEESSIMTEFELLRNEIIKVNEFSFDFSQVIA